MASKKPELERCEHSLTSYQINDEGRQEEIILPCTLIFHTQEDSKGRPIHQTQTGLTWS